MPGIRLIDLNTAVRATTRTARWMADKGHDVRRLARRLIPGEEVVQCLFEARTSQDVAEVNQRTEMPFERIVPVVVVGDPDVGRRRGQR